MFTSVKRVVSLQAISCISSSECHPTQVKKRQQKEMSNKLGEETHSKAFFGRKTITMKTKAKIVTNDRSHQGTSL